MSSTKLDTLKNVPFRLLLAAAVVACATILTAAACGPSAETPAASTASDSGSTSGTTQPGSAAQTTSSGSQSGTTTTPSEPAKQADPSMYASLSGDIPIDGSSTVFPITEAVAEEFGGLTDGSVRVVVGISAPAAASRSSATTRPSSPTPPAPSSRRKLTSAPLPAWSTLSCPWPSTACPWWSTPRTTS